MPIISNYFKVASRVMIRSKAYTTINLFGLTLGITSALLLFLWISHEASYDQFHADKDRIQVVWNRQPKHGDVVCWSMTPRILGPTLRAEFPAVEGVVSYASYQVPFLFTVGETRMVRNTGVFVDPDFLSMFSFPLLKGNVANALKEPSSIVLTEKFSKELFGVREPFGEMVSLAAEGTTTPFVVAGIMKDLPSNTDFRFDYLLPWKFLEKSYGEDTYWGNNSVMTLVKVREGANLAQLDQGIRNLKKVHTAGETTELFLHPFTKNHLYSDFKNGVQDGGRIEVIRMLGVLGVCLVIIACINFINLSTARAQRRAKEVGIRKVTGAFKSSLVAQFICESVILAGVAGILSIGIAFLALPSFNVLIKQQLDLTGQGISFWAITLGVVTAVGILAGSYPAFYLSSLNPVKVLKGASISFTSRSVLRHTLVVFQFGFAVTMIFAIIVVSQQIQYTQERKSGYNKGNLIYQELTGDLIKNFPSYKRELLLAGVAKSITRTSSPITERWSDSGSMKWRGKNPDDKTTVERFYIDENIAATAGITVMEGRDLDLQQFPSDSTAVLINESALALMGFKNPIGEVIEDNNIAWHVVGVVRDFVLTSPFHKVEPLVLQGCKQNAMFNDIHIKLNPDRPTNENLAMLSTLFRKYNPAYPFTYHFVEDEYGRKFADVKSTLAITTVFGFIAISIACLGLLGLSTYMIESRVKEIGIRRVLGGSYVNITWLLCWHSLKPILMAIILFSPVAWAAMRWWLESFDYRIPLTVIFILLPAVFIVSASMATIGIQTLIAARISPTTILKSE
jgi:ABC-type antimicrobial peptide transport system permease subunit